MNTELIVVQPFAGFAVGEVVPASEAERVQAEHPHHVVRREQAPVQES